MSRKKPMPEETEYLGHRPVQGDGYLEPDRYRVKCKCLRCGHVYSRVYKAVPKVDPPCPKKVCKEAIATAQTKKQKRHVKKMIETGETPGHIGNNLQVKAIDMTAEIVMEDHKMTDLKTNTRQGDTMVHGLTPRQREMSKDFWGGRKMSDRKRDPTYQMGVQDRGKRLVDGAMSGNFLPNVAANQPRDSQTGDHLLTDLHARKYKPPVDILFDSNSKRKKA